MATTEMYTSREVQITASNCPAQIRVKNLQASIRGPADAWGRSGRQQPLLVSAQVSMAKPFGASSSGDKVESDTVHYGLLSKAILSIISSINAAGEEKVAPLEGLVNELWWSLTGFAFVNHRRWRGAAEIAGSKAFLDTKPVQTLSITVHLPKGTLLGDGVSYTTEGLFAQGTLSVKGMTFTMHGIAVPTLVGVNKNERAAKQMVRATLEIGRCTDLKDQYNQLESLIVNVMSNSAFETLEALASLLLLRVSQHLHAHHLSKPDQNWVVGIALEKPVAVPFAETVCVEVRRPTSDVLAET